MVGGGRARRGRWRGFRENNADGDGQHQGCCHSRHYLWLFAVHGDSSGSGGTQSTKPKKSCWFPAWAGSRGRVAARRRKSQKAGNYEEKTIETRISPRIRGVSSETVSPWRRTRRSTPDDDSRRSRNTTSSRNSGRRGLRSRISPLNGSNSRPSEASSSVNGVALAQACGEQATG